MSNRATRPRKRPGAATPALEKERFVFPQREMLVDLYVDSARTFFNTYTFMITFGVISPGEEGKGQDQIDEVIRLRMSPQHAKAFAASLMSQVARFEMTQGPIAVPGIDLDFTAVTDLPESTTDEVTDEGV